MGAGDSARDEAKRQAALAEEYEAAAARARDASARYGLAATTESRMAALLACLTPAGYHLLPDRGWPGSRRAQVDMVVVGEAGVFIVDAKAWKDVSIADGRVFRGDADVTEELESLADLGRATEDAFAEVGLAPGEVHVIAALAGRSGIDARAAGIRIVGEKDLPQTILRRGRRLTPANVDRVLVHALDFFPNVGAAAPVNASIPEPVLPAPEPLRPEDLPSEAELRDAVYAGVMVEPVEEWMTFLHPSQAKLVVRSFNGPSRIRGPVGTGKTVVGLHRAAHLARNGSGRVLVTGYVRTLPGVLKSLFARLAPDLVDRVDFVGLHAWALRLLHRRGVEVRLDGDGANAAFDTAWLKVGRTGPLGQLSLPPGYWHDEMLSVVKGRGLTRFEEYADLARVGRVYRLSADLRHAVWELYEAYERQLRARGIHDFADVVLLAGAELARCPLEDGYATVIVDEAQDLTCAAARLLHRLVGDATDGLTLIGDGQQTIYPGGFTLAEAGISIAGRGVVLDVNYRNTEEILTFASGLVSGDEIVDIEGGVSIADLPSMCDRHGASPVVERFPSRAAMLAAMAARVVEVSRGIETGLGDVGVLCLTRAEVARAAAALEKAGIPTISLEDYDGKTVERVKVGTVKRAKGLEFKQVLLPEVAAAVWDATTPPADEDSEKWTLKRRELYVAATRARDGVWVGVVGGKNSPR